MASSGWRKPTISVACAVNRSGITMSKQAPIANTGTKTKRNSQRRRHNIRRLRSTLPQGSGAGGSAHSVPWSAASWE